MRRAIIEPRSYLERPPISWIFSLFGITQAKQSIAEVRASMASKWGFDYNLWSSVEAGDEEARHYFETWNAKVIASVPRCVKQPKISKKSQNSQWFFVGSTSDRPQIGLVQDFFVSALGNLLDLYLI